MHTIEFNGSQAVAQVKGHGRFRTDVQFMEMNLNFGREFIEVALREIYEGLEMELTPGLPTPVLAIMLADVQAKEVGGQL